MSTFRAGDIVTRPDWGLDTNGKQFTAIIDFVDARQFPDDPVAFFRGGGFWRTSRLEHAADASAKEGE